MINGTIAVLVALPCILAGCGTPYVSTGVRVPVNASVAVMPTTNTSPPVISDAPCSAAKSQDVLGRPNWASGYGQCEVFPLERYADRSFPLRSYWSGGQCVNGKAQGAGYAFWCAKDQECSPEKLGNHYLWAAGIARAMTAP